MDRDPGKKDRSVMEEEIVEDVSEAPASDVRKSPRPPLTDAEFAEIRELYELGTAGLSELAERYDISRQALSRRFKDAGAVRASRAHEVAAAAKKAVTSSPSAAGVAAIERFAEKRPGWIEETKLQGYSNLKIVEQLTKKLLSEHMRLSPTPPMAVMTDDLKAIERLGKILIENADARLRLLDADGYVAEEDLPSLTIEDVTDDEILEVFKNNGLMAEDATLEDMERDRRELEAVLEGDL